MPGMTPSIICHVAAVHDGDTIRCTDGHRIRIAGIDANELDGSCHNVCAPMTGQQARGYVSRLVLRRHIACQPVGTSYSRIVARCTLPDGRSLSCAAIAAGAAVRWDRYWRQYRMGECS